MRTTEEIMAEIDATQASIPELATLDSSSQVAFYRLLKRMWALLVQLVEKTVDDYKAKVEALLAEKTIGDLTWYQRQVFAFQFGDAVIVRGAQVTYATIDPAKQIIKQAAVTEDPVSGRLAVKAVKQGPGNTLTALYPAELAALKQYMREVKFAGVALDVVSLDADELKLVCVAKVDPQVMKPNGESLTAPGTYPVADAIAAYLRALPFDAVFSWTALTDYMQAQKGVKDFVVKQSFQRPSETGSWTAFERQFLTRAGHMVLKDSTITYA
ncbi:hypothetical protein ACFPMF_01670 [Larkinella bovis]|uniref:Baseplate protein J-like domain-containing protein n=1 Tax=Larkinella bovis TaxID=683041 RepID=A0ABW0I3X4_9BACT